MLRNLPPTNYRSIFFSEKSRPSPRPTQYPIREKKWLYSRG